MKSALRTLLLGLTATATITGSALASTVLPLNTGYNHATSVMYAPGQADNYWTRIYSTNNMTTVPPSTFGWQSHHAWVFGPPSTLPNNQNVWQTIPNALYIGAAPVSQSTSTYPNNFGFTVYKKCFCLAPNAQNIRLDINQMRADDEVRVVFEGSTWTQLIAMTPGHYLPSTSPLQAHLIDQTKFKKGGRNCLYVIVKNYSAGYGFALSGQVSATAGLWDMAALGPNHTSYMPYNNCACSFPITTASGAAVTLKTAEVEDQEAMTILNKYIEEFRTSPRLSAPRATLPIAPGVPLPPAKQ